MVRLLLVLLLVLNSGERFLAEALEWYDSNGGDDMYESMTLPEDDTQETPVEIPDWVFTPGVINEGVDCYLPCGKDGGHCPAFCGNEGYCCREDWEGEESNAVCGSSGCTGYHCCTSLIVDGKTCAQEGEECECDGYVRYGEDKYGKEGWTEWMEVSGKVLCDNEVFGDPRPRAKKVCQCQPKNLFNVCDPELFGSCGFLLKDGKYTCEELESLGYDCTGCCGADETTAAPEKTETTQASASVKLACGPSTDLIFVNEDIQTCSSYCSLLGSDCVTASVGDGESCTPLLQYDCTYNFYLDEFDVDESNWTTAICECSSASDDVIMFKQLSEDIRKTYVETSNKDEDAETTGSLLASTVSWLIIAAIFISLVALGSRVISMRILQSGKTESMKELLLPSTEIPIDTTLEFNFSLQSQELE